MTTGMMYSDFVAQIALLAVVSPTDPNFLAALPQATTYAENRIYRDIDLLSTVLTNNTYAFTANLRTVNVPISTFVTLQQVNVITPYGVTNPELGTRNPLLPATKEYLDNVWGNSTGAAVPVYFAMINQSQFVVGPWPDQAYQMELVGTIRPASLSASNTSTALSLYWPDLLIMATMVYVTMYQRDFGKTADEPQMAGSYETQYQTLLKSAVVEEGRKKFTGAAWSSMSPAVTATPTRG